MAPMDPAEQQRRLLDALADPARFPHPVERVERIETHISVVLLAGEFAYKIKKPLDVGFLDFSTLERRRHFCEEELRLNRRLAPDLYLEVLPITGTPEQPRLGGEGEAIEYALCMRRFPQEALLGARLARSELPAAVMDELAAELADFHARAAVAAPDSGYGDFAAIAGPARDNLTVLAERLPAAERSGLAALRDATEADLARLAPVFEARLRAGRVRECHGDLHLGNMLHHQGRLLIFDGIEFDPLLRWIDVMNDLAFALMDLDYRGAPTLARRLKAAYLERGGDYQGLAVLRFYQGYRALVRAKIAALRAGQLRGEDCRQAWDECRGYLALAQRYAAAPRPYLAITCGASGSGKSTLAQRLVEQGGFVRLRSDLERKRLHGLAAEARSDSPLGDKLYTAAATDATYARLLELAEAALRAGERVVVDASFLQRERREPFCQLARRLDVPFSILLLQGEPEALAARIEQRRARGGDPSEATVEVLRHQLATAQWPTTEEGALLTLAADGSDWDARLGGLTEVGG